MAEMKPCGTFPTPYGVSVLVYQPDVVDPADPERVLFNMDATAICAGIYDLGARVDFAAEAKRIGRMPDPKQFGGGTLKKVALPKPQNPAYPRVRQSPVGSPIERWTDGALDRFRWCDRAEFFVDILGDNMERFCSGQGIVEEIYPLGMSIMLTATLEHYCETEINCLEAAAIYSLSEHAEWRRAGHEWLEPVRGTWFRDWRVARPRYTSFAKALRRWMDLPLWLTMPGDPA